jgi:hypothetical protein
MSNTATPFEGRTGAMRTSPWLAAENLDGLGDIKCVIEGVFKHSKVRMQDGKEQAQIFTLKFVGKEMELVLNATNRKTLAAKFGVNVVDWKGKEIVLYVQDGVKCPSGGKCKGIRIK